LTEKRIERARILDTDHFAGIMNSLAETERLWLQQFETILMSQLGNPDFSVPALAASMGISRNTLYRRLYEITGMKPGDFIQEARLQKARYLLEQRRYRDTGEIMNAVGLKDTRYFFQIYYSRFGKAPDSYFAV